jgi:hypothetical protein
MSATEVTSQDLFRQGCGASRDLSFTSNGCFRFDLLEKRLFNGNGFEHRSTVAFITNQQERFVKVCRHPG